MMFAFVHNAETSQGFIQGESRGRGREAPTLHSQPFKLPTQI